MTHNSHNRNNSGGHKDSLKNDLAVFTGFKSALEACYLDWEEYTLPGITYTAGSNPMYHCPFTCFRHVGDSRSEVNQVNTQPHSPRSNHGSRDPCDQHAAVLFSRSIFKMQGCPLVETNAGSADISRTACSTFKNRIRSFARGSWRSGRLESVRGRIDANRRRHSRPAHSAHPALNVSRNFPTRITFQAKLTEINESLIEIEHARLWIEMFRGLTGRWLRSSANGWKRVWMYFPGGLRYPGG